ncbi:MAG: hypothetical protein LBC52_01050 [Treponema sp.]|nr:hypothetical protein [Treponema sp.]
MLPVTSLPASPLHSTTWGFWLDLPEGYEYIDGNNQDRYSFQGPNKAMFDVVVYNGVYQDVEQMANDVNRRIGNSGEIVIFEYEGKPAAMMDLHFKGFSGWGLCVELAKNNAAARTPFLCALAYSPSSGADMDLFHISALDSIAPSDLEARRPGPIMEFGYPRGETIEIPIKGTAFSALIRENDAEAAQALVDREFNLLRNYENAKGMAQGWQQAWIRFYRAIYRDSWDRMANALFRLEREWNADAGLDERAFAEKALDFVQGFTYDRDLEGSDFVNLVTAVSEGRGDCDSRSMLWAMILDQADIPAAMMVSRGHSHAMGLADVPGSGARFDSGGKKWLVAETTDKIGIGLISADMSDIASWLGVIFNIP